MVHVKTVRWAVYVPLLGDIRDEYIILIEEGTGRFHGVLGAGGRIILK
jgi:hypothetical protein